MIRKGSLGDLDAIVELYKAAAAQGGGLIRTQDEITKDYIQNFLTKSLATGIILIAESENKQLIGEIHAYKGDPKVLAHNLTQLTIVVHPAFQGKGIGKLLFTTLLDDIKTSHPEILRVELMARETNLRALDLYKKLGFKVEGSFEKRVRVRDTFVADIAMAWFNPNFRE